MTSLWGFEKRDLSKEAIDEPTKILKEQIMIFEAMTQDKLHASLNTFRVKDPECEYPIGTNFEIIAPYLNGYRYQLFVMYSKPIHEYPILLFTETLPEEGEVHDINADYTCNNKEEFVDAMSNILGSSETKRIVQVLYSKSLV